MPALSTFGWVLHDLGLASLFGGGLFGRVAMNRALREISSKPERAKVMNAAWMGYNVVNVASMGAVALTWLVGRSMLSGREIDRETRGLVLVKDALVGACTVSGVASLLTAGALAREGDGAIPIESGNQPAAETPRKAAGLLRTLNVLGPLNIALSAGILGITTVLSMKSSESQRFSLISHFLP